MHGVFPGPPVEGVGSPQALRAEGKIARRRIDLVVGLIVWFGNAASRRAGRRDGANAA
ncbi:hypothetical protein [Streptomyces marianii]|uniref:hypothetical protein n=1 Tax=Streptomyces marianii TaxID=1817406 RepID=UPI0014860DF7|nr:hypothetical protein [Streptomyces marianii]